MFEKKRKQKTIYLKLEKLNRKERESMILED